MIISIEGPDFVGKDTVIHELLHLAPEWFPEGTIKVVSFPNWDTEIGRMCRKMLTETQEWSKAEAAIFQLLNTAHRYEYYNLFKQMKQSEHDLLFIIRYNLSGPIYASIDGLNATKTWQLYDWFEDVLPDFTFILFRHYDFHTFSSQRVPEHYETEPKQQKVRDLYLLSPSLWGDKLGKVTILNNDDIHTTVTTILKVIKEEKR